jgi:hypothetical protein
VPMLVPVTIIEKSSASFSKCQYTKKHTCLPTKKVGIKGPPDSYRTGNNLFFTYLLKNGFTTHNPWGISCSLRLAFISYYLKISINDNLRR